MPACYVCRIVGTPPRLLFFQVGDGQDLHREPRNDTPQCAQDVICIHSAPYVLVFPQVVFVGRPLDTVTQTILWDQAGTSQSSPSR